MFVYEMEVRGSVSLIISKMGTSHTAPNLVQYCILIEFFRTATAFVSQNALGSPRVLVPLASGSV
jgi:hypothetical protein